ncbi:hypothetical protein Tco_1567003 [Tanacetum coccineum]
MSLISRLMSLMTQRVSTISVAVSGVLGDGSRVHIHDHDGSEAPNESPDSILSSEPKPLGKGESSASPSTNQPAACPYRLAVIYETYYPERPLVKHTSPVYHAHGAQQAL